MTRNGVTVLIVGVVGAVLWVMLGVTWARWIPTAAVILLLPGSRLWVWPVGRYDAALTTRNTTVNRDSPVHVSIRLRPLTRRTARWLVAELILLDVPARRFVSGRTVQHQPLPAVIAARGDRRCTVRRLWATDLFALWRREVRIRHRQDQTVRVLPRQLPFSGPRSTVARDDVASPTSIIARGGSLFAAHREYEHGDDVRLIDWAVTARSTDGTVMVRQNAQSLAGMLRIGFDRTVPAGAGYAESFEVCVDIVYSLTLAASAVGDDVSLGRAVGERAIVERLMLARPSTVQARPDSTDNVPAWPASADTVLVRCGPAQAVDDVAAPAMRFAVVPPGTSAGTVPSRSIVVESLEQARDAWAELRRS